MKKLLLAALFSLALGPLAAVAAPIDINTADAVTLEQIKGIGPAKAQAIVDYRDKNGAFGSAEELIKVPGIGAKSLEQIRDQITVGTVRKAKATH